MNKLICVLICLVGLALSECKTSAKATNNTVASPAPVKPAVEAKPAAPDSTAMAIASGQSVYQAKCGGCHDLPRLTDHSADEWPDIMVKMSRKAHLSEAETGQVLAYINNGVKQ